MNTNHNSSTTITIKGTGGLLAPKIHVGSDLHSPTEGRKVEIQVLSGESGAMGFGGYGRVEVGREEAQDLMEALAYHLNAKARTEF